MKSKSIGSLIVLAILAPSCGGGGKNPKVPPAPNIPRWTSQYRTPTTSNLRGVRFNDAMNGLAVGEAGTIILTDNAGASWKPLETVPSTRGGDILAVSALGRSIVAVGVDDTNAGARYWWSDDTTSFFTEDVAGFDPPRVYTDVMVLVGIGNGQQRISLHLRSNGILDLYSPTKATYEFDTSLNPFPAAPTPWVRANAMFIGPDGTKGWIVGSKAGPAGQIRHQLFDITGTWTDSVLPGGTPPLIGIWMVTPTLGYACGDAGTVLQGTVAGAPATTTWTAIAGGPGGGTTFRAIKFVDLNNGWVVGDDGTNGCIYKLTYNGASWTWGTKITAPTKLYALSAVSLTTAFAVGDAGLVFRTQDGTTWNDLRKPVPLASPRINALDFEGSGTVGVAAGNGGVVLRTLDGGATWTTFAGGIPGGFDVKGVCIPRRGSGTVAYLCGTNAIYKNTTLDQAVPGSWTVQAATGTFESILFANGDLNGVCIGAGAMVFTTDGAAWSNTPATPPVGTFHALACNPAGTKIYAAGNTGAVSSTVDDPSTAATVDLGNVWTGLTAVPSGGNLLSIQAPEGSINTLFVGSDNGNVYRLPFGTTTWVTSAVQAASPVVALAFGDDLNGVAVVQGGTPGVFWTMDGGASAWTKSALHVKLNGGNLLRAAWLNPSLTGWIAGDNGLILKTTTGGK